MIAILIAAAIPAILFVSLLAYWSYEAGKAAGLDALTRDVALLTSRFDAIPAAAGRLSWVLASAVSWDAELDSERCNQNIKPILPSFPGYSGIMIYRGDALFCSFNVPFAQSQTASLRQLGLGDIPNSEPRAGILSDATGSPVIYAAARAGGEMDRALTAVLTIDPRFLTSLLGLFRSLDSSHALLVDRQGRSLGAPGGGDLTNGPRLATPLPNANRISTVSDASGRAYVVTSNKLSSPDLWIVTQQREADVLAGARNQLILSVISPVLTLLMVGLAVWFGLTQFVIRWINRLILVTRAYSEGDLGARVGDAAAAPSEIRELARRFDGLADRMAERAVELEGEVFQKRRYIRELHHRVKNNLQVIASLLALQKRHLPPQQRSILRFPSDRVNAMAAAFSVSYAQTESGDVGALAVIREVVTRLQSGADSGHPQLRLKISGEDRQIDLDTAMTIAMLLAEILPPFFAADPPGAGTDMSVALANDYLIVRVSGPASTAQARDRLSDRFMRAYLRQLNATYEEPSPGEFSLSIRLRADPASQAVA